MKKYYLLILLALCIISTSCEKCEKPVDYSLKIGNIYCENGSIIPPSEYNNTNKGIGVVCYVGNENSNYKAIIIGKEKIGKAMYSNICWKISDNTDDKNALSGKENTANMIISAKENEEYKVPAAELAYNYSLYGINGWHLPSCGELIYVTNNKWLINNSLSLIGGENLNEENYLTSSQDGTNDKTAELYALTVSMAEGRILSISKQIECEIRPFIAIN